MVFVSEALTDTFSQTQQLQPQQQKLLRFLKNNTPNEKIITAEGGKEGNEGRERKKETLPNKLFIYIQRTSTHI